MELLIQAYFSWIKSTLLCLWRSPVEDWSRRGASTEFSSLGKATSMWLQSFFHHFKMPKVPASQMYPKSIWTSVFLLLQLLSPDTVHPLIRPLSPVNLHRAQRVSRLVLNKNICNLNFCSNHNLADPGDVVSPTIFLMVAICFPTPHVGMSEVGLPLQGPEYCSSFPSNHSWIIWGQNHQDTNPLPLRVAVYFFCYSPPPAPRLHSLRTFSI